MSSPCTNCLPQGKQQEDQQLSSALIKAKAHAEKNKATVALYKDDEGQWQYADAFTVAAGGYPLTKLVSFDR
jgi:hypothetical protein